MSDLLLRQRRAAPDSGEALWLPAPGHVVERKAPIGLEFELYNLKADETGTARYEVEEKILTLFEKPGFFDHLASYGQLAGQAVFPLYTFVGQVGAFALSQALADEDDDVVLQKRTSEAPAAAVVREQIKLDLNALKPGIYTVYITVRDLVSREITSRFLTLQVV